MLADKQIEDIALKYTRLCGGHWEHEEAIPDRDVIDFAREIEKENKRLKKRVVELTEMLIEVRDNPNNNVFEKFEEEANGRGQS